MKAPQTYVEHQSAQILRAYQALLPNIPPELETFLDLKKDRPWSVLTSDFNATPHADFQTFHERLGSVNYSTKPSELGVVLAELSRAHKVGFSHGFSPWTDSMLLETFSSDTRRLLIILGHDWYPIVTQDFDLTAQKGYAAVSPLIRQSPCDEYPHAFPRKLIAHPDRAVVFVNLYPDFRAPGEEKMGNVGAHAFVAAFTACCREFARTYAIDAVISWGDPVWQALRRYVAPGSQGEPEGIKAAALSGPFTLDFDGLAIPYHPFAHPCFRGNFNGDKHLATFQRTCSTI